MVLDWWFHATSLVNLTRNMFRELGLLMNHNKDFTLTGIKLGTIGLGNINKHFDCVHIPNMGGYRFPPLSTLSSKNLLLSPSGIDEVVLGREVFKSETLWKKYSPIIKNEVAKWEQYVDKIKAVHVVTESEKNDMINYLKIPEEKFVIIPHGVDHDLFRPPKDKIKARRSILGKFLLKDHPYFVHVSESNWARKNIFRIFEAFRKAKEDGLKHNLIVIGKNDPVVYEKAKNVPGIIIVGFVSQEHLVELMGSADAMVLPSLHEGFGLPLLEGMACGLPSITSNVFSPPEVIGDTGLLVDPHDTLEIKDALIDMSNNPEQRDNLSKKAYERSKLYSWKKTASQIYELYKKLCEESTINLNTNEDLDLAGYRTLVTVCELKPDLKQMVTQDLLEFDYSRIINWSLEVGLSDPDVKDFLIPFKNWLITKSEE